MARKKITVVGAGNVGATTAQIAAMRNLGDIVLLDIVQGLAEGKALDISQAGGVYAFEGSVTGTMNWQTAAGSDIVIVTSGIPRKPGMSRDDLVEKNTEIVKSVSQSIAKFCPEAFVIVVCNPLDAMVYAAAKTTCFPHSRILGMAGALDAARYALFIANELGVSVADVRAVLMGGHGDDMVPLPRYTSVAGIPVVELVEKEALERIIERTRKGGIEIVTLLGYSAYYAPAAGAVRMAEAILLDSKARMSCCAWCDREYGVGGAFVGVPVILGAGGVERIIELDLNEQERAALTESVGHVKQLMVKVDAILAS
ncbi:MAG: malate dehydrogenase [Sedimentisphaerales bacterium]|nr:malate dehydrogenase [Sedimentisphaerales bacterium]